MIDQGGSYGAKVGVAPEFQALVAEVYFCDIGFVDDGFVGEDAVGYVLGKCG